MNLSSETNDSFDTNILITGATGSFGSTFVREWLRQESFLRNTDSSIHFPKNDNGRVVIYSRDEVKQSVLRRELESEFPQQAHRLRFFLGDIRDEKRLYRALNGIDVVIHACALKRINDLEYNPTEAVKTNVIGAMNLIEATLENGVKKVIALSSDKSCEAFNLYGATKLLAEHIFSQANVYHPTRFASVRYGNVVGSRGSVIPLWREQAAKHPLGQGKITITDPNMTRFWITLPQAARFVMSCLQTMQGGEVFVPKLPSCTVGDLAKLVEPIAEWEIVGLRPGEKMHELLISNNEAPQVYELGDRYIVYPSVVEWQMEKRGKPVGTDFVYTSSQNGHSMTASAIQKMLEET